MVIYRRLAGSLFVQKSVLDGALVAMTTALKIFEPRDVGEKSEQILPLGPRSADLPDLQDRRSKRPVVTADLATAPPRPPSLSPRFTFVSIFDPQSSSREARVSRRNLSGSRRGPSRTDREVSRSSRERIATDEGENPERRDRPPRPRNPSLLCREAWPLPGEIPGSAREVSRAEEEGPRARSEASRLAGVASSGEGDACRGREEHSPVPPEAARIERRTSRVREDVFLTARLTCRRPGDPSLSSLGVSRGEGETFLPPGQASRLRGETLRGTCDVSLAGRDVSRAVRAPACPEHGASPGALNVSPKERQPSPLPRFFRGERRRASRRQPLEPLGVVDTKKLAAHFRLFRTLLCRETEDAPTPE